ncbi:hypothetical protein ACROYT_G030911 [Oculina patagonica]
MLIEVPNPVLAGKIMKRLKGLEAKVKILEENMVEEGKCKACSLIDQLTQRLNNIDEEIAEMKRPVTTASPPPTTAPPPPATAECQTYKKLTSADRKVTYGKPTRACDSQIDPGWYRFEGAAGTKMPTSTPGMNKCDADAPGWLNGAHPTVAEGIVTRQVCFHWSHGPCTYNINIEVRNCGSFYVYNLKQAPGCSIRYCGSD